MRALAIIPAVAAGIVVGAKTTKIEVGERGLTFDPDVIKADVGDTLEFVFFPQNHSVAQGDFARPCQPGTGSQGGFHSGFQSVSRGEGQQKFVVTVKSTDPIYFYCPTPGHCRSGMVGVVNPPGDDTFDSYKKAAHDVHSEGVPDGVFGGDLLPNDDDGSPTSPSTVTSTSSETSTSSSTRSSKSEDRTTTSGTGTGGGGGTPTTSSSTSSTSSGSGSSTTSPNAAAGLSVGPFATSWLAVCAAPLGWIVFGFFI